MSLSVVQRRNMSLRCLVAECPERSVVKSWPNQQQLTIGGYVKNREV
jgi:hypothetical protein